MAFFVKNDVLIIINVNIHSGIVSERKEKGVKPKEIIKLLKIYKNTML